MLYLLGVALIYGAYGTLDIVLLAKAGAPPSRPCWSRLALMTAGLLAKTALFPLHLWLPPAHAGAPPAGQRDPLGAGGQGLVLPDRAPLVRPAAGAGTVPAQLLGLLGAGAIIVGSVLALRRRG